jgi:hypothetical protein
MSTRDYSKKYRCNKYKKASDRSSNLCKYDKVNNAEVFSKYPDYDKYFQHHVISDKYQKRYVKSSSCTCEKFNKCFLFFTTCCQAENAKLR